MIRFRKFGYSYLSEKVIPRHATGVLWRGILFENKLYTIFQVIISSR